MADYVIKRKSTATPVFSTRTETLTLGAANRTYTTSPIQSTVTDYSVSPGYIITSGTNHITFTQSYDTFSVAMLTATGSINSSTGIATFRSNVNSATANLLYFEVVEDGFDALANLYDVDTGEQIYLGGYQPTATTMVTGTTLGTFTISVDFSDFQAIYSHTNLAMRYSATFCHAVWSAEETQSFYLTHANCSNITCRPPAETVPNIDGGGAPLRLTYEGELGTAVTSTGINSAMVTVRATCDPTYAALNLPNVTIPQFSTSHATSKFNFPFNSDIIDTLYVDYDYTTGVMYNYTFNGSDRLTYSPVFAVSSGNYTLISPSGAKLSGTPTRSDRTVSWECSGTSTSLPSISELNVKYRYLSGSTYDYYFPIYFNGTLKHYKRIYFNGVAYNASNYPS